jgi:hypothetical protein
MNKNWKIFVSFLEQNGVLAEYQTAVKSLHEYPEEKLAIIKKSEAPVDYLDRSFLWRSTHEGHFFWENLNKKWVELVLNVKELFDFREEDAFQVISTETLSVESLSSDVFSFDTISSSDNPTE